MSITKLKQESENILVESFSTKQQATEELEFRKHLCDMFKINLADTYYIQRGTKNANTRLGEKRTMPIVRC